MTHQRLNLTSLLVTVAAIGAIAASFVALAQPASGTHPTALGPDEISRVDSFDADPIPRLEARLHDLDGSDALAYFRLGEDLAYLTDDPRATTLAKQLFVIAWEVDRAQPDDGKLGLGRSVCLALADVSGPRERRYLLALADSLPGAGEHAVAAWIAAVQRDTRNAGGVQINPDDRRSLVEAIARFRAGDGAEVINILEDLDATRVLRAAGLPADDAVTVVRSLRTIEAEPRCPRCRNSRLIRTGPDDDTGLRYELCPNCGGHPGPNLTDRQLAGLFRAEALLLRASATTWAGQRLIDGGSPIRTLDPAGLAASVGVSPNARRYVFDDGDVFRGTWR
jgi:hypothetical protein